MEFVIIAYDGQDEKAIERRMSVREAHLALATKMQASGKMLNGGAILDQSGKMIGSVVIYDFASQEEFDDYFEEDPYITGGVWQNIQVHNFKVAPMFRTTN